jgi:hypothetical protein
MQTVLGTCICGKGVLEDRDKALAVADIDLGFCGSQFESGGEDKEEEGS